MGHLICGGQCPTRIRRQQGGGVMICAGIVGDELVGPVRVQLGVKLTSHTARLFLKVPITQHFDQYFLTCIAKITLIHSITFLVEFL